MMINLRNMNKICTKFFKGVKEERKHTQKMKNSQQKNCYQGENKNCDHIFSPRVKKSNCFNESRTQDGRPRVQGINDKQLREI